VPERHSAGNTSALRARAPSGLAAGVSTPPVDRDSPGRRIGQGVYIWRLESENATLTRKAIKIDWDGPSI